MKTLTQLRAESHRLMDDEIRHLPPAQRREFLDTLISDAETRIECLNEEEDEE